VAPSLIPQTPGERLKPDRRDAGQRARLARSGDLTAVDVPTGEDAAIRDLTRARDDPSSALQDATSRLNACLRRHDSRDTGRAHWGPAHRRWLSAVVCPTPAHQLVFHEDGRAVREHHDRLQRLDQARRAHVPAWRLAPVVEALQAWRGGQLIAAVTLVADRGDRTRVESPRALMNWRGLIPADYSAGEQRRQGSLTNAGNTHARRVLVDGAWAERYPATVSRPRQRRLGKPPQVIQDLRWQAQVRRCQRYRRRSSRGQHAHGVTVASARELSGFRWAMATEVPAIA
jgi:transposase